MTGESDQEGDQFIPRTRPFVSGVPTRPLRRSGRKSKPEPGTVPNGARRLCAAVDIVGWSSRANSSARAEATHALVEALRAAGERAKVPIDEWTKHPGGDGGLIVFPAEIDESAMIAALVGALSTKLIAYNRTRPAGERLRVRLSIAQGTLHATELGFCDDVTICVARLVDSSALRAALVGYPAADIAVIVSEDLFHDVVSHERHGPPHRSFWPVIATGKDFRARAWSTSRTARAARPARPKPT